VRLALEFAEIEYLDVARHDEAEGGGGEGALQRSLQRSELRYPPFAPPYLKSVDLIIGQTANILLFLGNRHALAPLDEAGWLWTHQIQLTMADFVAEIHDTHHPIGVGQYFEDQREAARRRAKEFRANRLPKFLGYFETIIDRNPAGSGLLVGDRITYVDLSAFQLVEGLRYAFPKLMRAVTDAYPRLISLHNRISTEPHIAAYLASSRRIPFNEKGIFRHYDELDAKERSG
jgi:glutathione S-transferase